MEYSGSKLPGLRPILLWPLVLLLFQGKGDAVSTDVCVPSIPLLNPSPPM